jgi:hypothetical protein
MLPMLPMLTTAGADPAVDAAHHQIILALGCVRTSGFNAARRAGRETTLRCRLARPVGATRKDASDPEICSASSSRLPLRAHSLGCLACTLACIHQALLNWYLTSDNSTSQSGALFESTSPLVPAASSNPPPPLTIITHVNTHLSPVSRSIMFTWAKQT